MRGSQVAPGGARLLALSVGLGFPRVGAELRRWAQVLENCRDEELACQAKASMKRKRFHCIGGSVYAFLCLQRWSSLVSLVVAYQTISDYLDNLCDRAGVQDETGFRRLHQAMLDALDPSTPGSDYYFAYPVGADGGYLESLVSECRARVSELASYPVVRAEVLRLATLYCELQVLKHLPLAEREDRLIPWAISRARDYPGLRWNEYAAATGSTLGIFVLLAAAARPDLDTEEVRALLLAYFPWICGLHILLDYFIDQAEDRAHGDLNFVSYYPDPGIGVQRLRQIAERCREAAGALPDASFHRTVVEGLLALYLSDAKAYAPGLREGRQLLLSRGALPWLLHGTCRALRCLELL